jgi:hypothetical protein
MTIDDEKLIDKLWDMCFDWLAQSEALFIYSSSLKGQALEITMLPRDDFDLPQNRKPPQKYMDGFNDRRQKKLEDITRLQPDSSRRFYLLYGLDGKQKAYKFALEVDADEEKIQAELDRKKELLEWSLSTNQGSARPTASPRIYSDGYREGLQQILDMIQEYKANGA